MNYILHSDNPLKKQTTTLNILKTFVKSMVDHDFNNTTLVTKMTVECFIHS